MHVEDQRFEQDFPRLVVDTSSQRKKRAKSVLARLEADASGRACDPETDPATMEHILPENPAESWDASFPRRSWAAVYRLGNLALLEPAANRRASNAEFDSKLTEYARSNYALTRTIPELAADEWTPAGLDERQRRMARRAVHLWRADYT